MGDQHPPLKAPRGAGASALALVAAGAVAVVTAVGVRGDFPLSDDWAYAYPVRSLCEHGTLELMLPWSGASLLLQAWIGAALCKLFGFSFTILRIATVVSATAGAVGFYLLAREYRPDVRALALATAVFALDPLYVNLAFTFMTDVPFVALAVWAALYYVRGLTRRDLRSLVIGSVFCACAALVRQHAIFVSGAAAVAVLVAYSDALVGRIRAAVAAVALPIAVFVAYHVWLFAVHGAPPAVTIRLEQQSAFDPLTLGNVGYRGVAYLGLLTLPLALAAMPALRRRSPSVLAASGALLATVAAFLYLREGALMFYLTNTLYDLGVGALTLRDTAFLGLAPPLHGGTGVHVALTVAAVSGAAILLTATADAIRNRQEPSAAFAAAAFILVFGGSLLTQSRLYLDRHVLAAVPFGLLLLLRIPHVRRPGWAAWGAALALGWLAVAGTHDYLAWNRARFALLDELEKSGVSAKSIDGGVEYNGWRLAAELGTWPSMEGARIGQPAERRSWWWVVDDQYVATFRLLDGYLLREEREYSRWLIPGRGRVLLLQRDRPPS